jgi:hypothetical protein
MNLHSNYRRKHTVIRTVYVRYLDHERDANDALRFVLCFGHIVVQFRIETVKLNLKQIKKYVTVRGLLVAQNCFK